MASSPSERRGIPAAPFVHDVQTYLSQSALDANSALSTLQERLQQYKIAEMKLLAQKRELQAKIPDIKKCLAILESLISKQGTGEHKEKMFAASERVIVPSEIMARCSR